MFGVFIIEFKRKISYLEILLRYCKVSKFF